MNDNYFKTKVRFSDDVETRSWCWVSSCRCSLTFSHSWRFPTPPISMRPRIQHLLIQTGFFKSFLWNDFFFKSIRILQFPPFQDTCDLHCLFTWLLWCLLQHTSGLEMTWFNCFKIFLTSQSPESKSNYFWSTIRITRIRIISIAMYH